MRTKKNYFVLGDLEDETSPLAVFNSSEDLEVHVLSSNAAESIRGYSDFLQYDEERFAQHSSAYNWIHSVSLFGMALSLLVASFGGTFYAFGMIFSLFFLAAMFVSWFSMSFSYPSGNVLIDRNGNYGYAPNLEISENLIRYGDSVEKMKTYVLADGFSQLSSKDKYSIATSERLQNWIFSELELENLESIERLLSNEEISEKSSSHNLRMDDKSRFVSSNLKSLSIKRNRLKIELVELISNLLISESRKRIDRINNRHETQEISSSILAES